MSNRQIKFNCENFNLSKSVNRGIPQGSPLSSDIFSFNTKEINTQNSENTKTLQFADDITFIVIHKNIDTLKEIARNTILKFQQILNKLELPLNIDKCKILRLFPKNLDEFISININNITLKEEKT